jgi:magnesium-transporting ATPase (P-type)
LQEINSRLNIGNEIVDFNSDHQFLYKGSKLKNTEWVWGLVIYTGVNTKIMLNSQTYSSKISTVEIKLNYFLIILMLVEIAISLILAGLSVNSYNHMHSLHSYINWQHHSRFRYFIISFFNYIINFSGFIPVSLIVSIDLIKIAQSYFIDFDQLMFS